MSHKEIILADELRRLRNQEQPNEGGAHSKERERVLVLENTNITSNGTIRPSDTTKDGPLQTFPIRAKGKINSFVVRAKSKDFNFYLSVDGNDIIDSKSFDNLLSISQDMSNISAYDYNNEYIISADGYPFHEIVRAGVERCDGVEFKLIRAELFLDEIHNNEQ